jgi:tetratricopeptide (TPR) repeat protein
MTGLPASKTLARSSIPLLVCFALAFTGRLHAAAAVKSESPAALLLEARGAAASIEDRAQRSAALDPVVLAQIVIDPPGARDTLRAFPKLPNKLNYLSALAAAFAKTRNIAETERIYAEIVVEDHSSRPGKLAAANALGQVAIAHANKGNLEEAFRTLDLLKERTKQEPPAIVGIVTATLAEAQAKHGDVEGAVKTAMTLAGENPVPLMHIVGDRVRKGKAQEAQDIVARLDDASQQYAQWGVMQAQIAQGRLIEAQVTASGIKPGHAKASALLELATYHVEHGGQPLALTLLQEAEASGRSTLNNWTRADTLWHIAAETALAGDAERAISIAKSIEPEGHRRSAIYDIAKAQATRGEFAGAFNTASLLKRTSSTTQTTSGYDTIIFEILAEMVKAGKGKEATDTAARFQDTDIRRSWLYSGVAMAYAEVGNLKEAKAVLALAETEAQRSERRNELRQIAEKIRLGHDPADQTRLEELLRVGLDIEPALSAIAKALAHKGDLTGAAALADQLNQPAQKLVLIKDVAAVHIHQGRKEDTLRWARSLPRASEKTFALVGIATALSRGMDKRTPARPSPHMGAIEGGAAKLAWLPTFRMPF